MVLTTLFLKHEHRVTNVGPPLTYTYLKNRDSYGEGVLSIQGVHSSSNLVQNTCGAINIKLATINTGQ